MRNFLFLQCKKVPPPKPTGTPPIREILYKLLGFMRKVYRRDIAIDFYRKVEISQAQILNRETNEQLNSLEMQKRAILWLRGSHSRSTSWSRFAVACNQKFPRRWEAGE